MNSNLMAFQNSFESMIDIIIQKLNSKKNKNFTVNNLIESWKLSALKEIHEKNIKLKPSKLHSLLIDKKVGRRNTVGFFPRKLTLDEETKIEHITFNLQKEKNIEFLNRFADEEGLIDKKIAENLFVKDSYYEDDYLECIYYFRYKYFKDLINYFDKSKNENKSDINKLRGVYIDVLKAFEKFKILKSNMDKIEFKESTINSMVFGISNINMFFAKMEEYLANEHKRDIKNKLNSRKRLVKIIEPNAYKQNPTFEYINSVISDWHDRNLKTPDQVEAFLEQRKKQTKDLKEMKSKVSKANYEQRQYDNLDFLYANNVTDNMDNNK